VNRFSSQTATADVLKVISRSAFRSEIGADDLDDSAKGCARIARHHLLRDGE